jgi:hypothetical protein
MGNLQVIKNRRGREWTPHYMSLGALIRNGMGIMLLFSVPYVLLLNFHEINDEQRLYEIS